MIVGALTRRAALGAVVALIAVPTAPFADAATIGPTAFKQLLTDFLRLRSIEQSYDRDVLEVAQESLAARCSLIPHVTATYDSIGGPDAMLSTASAANVKIAQRHVDGMAKGGWDGNDRFNRACRKVVAGATWRQRQVSTIKREIGLGHIEAQSEAHGDASYAACWASIECQVASFADLLAKIDLIDEQEKWECESAREAVVADIRHLAAAA